MPAPSRRSLRERYLDLFRHHAPRLDRHAKPWFERGLTSPKTRLLTQVIIPSLYVPGSHYRYTAWSADVHRDGWPPSATAALLKAAPPDLPTFGMALFTNPLSWEQTVAVGSGDEARWVDLRPKDRAFNAGHVIYTFECDEVDAVPMGIEWLDRGLLQGFDTSMRHQYRDYLGYTVVYSGGKSLHVHLTFDIRHLSRDLSKSSGGRWANFVADLPHAKLRPACKILWSRLTNILAEALRIDASKFDARLAQWEQMRRMPYGIRQAAENHPLGIPATLDGEPSFVLQVVLAEHLRTRATTKGACWFHDAPEMESLVVEAVLPSAPRSEPTRPLFIDFDPTLAAALDKWMRPTFRRLLGRDYPEPVGCTFETGDVVFRFRNHADDTEPSSYMRGRASAIDILGRAPGLPAHVKVGRSANVLMRDFLDSDAVSEVSVEIIRSIRKLIEPLVLADDIKMPADILATEFRRDVQKLADLRPWMARQMQKLLEASSKHIAILSIEGAGKTTGVLSGLPSFTQRQAGLSGSQSPGWLIVSTPSYAQAWEKFEAIEKIAEASSAHIRPFMMLSVSRLYQECLQGMPELTELDVYTRGHSSFLRLIAEDQPEVFTRMLKYRRSLLDIIDQGFQPVICTVHDVVERFNASMTRPFYTREFEEIWMSGMPGRDQKKRFEALRDAYPISLLIVDEVNVDNLISARSTTDVEWCKRCSDFILSRVPSNKREEHRAYKQFHEVNPAGAVSWTDYRTITGVGFSAADQIVVDTSQEVPFPENPGMYVAVNGSSWSVKPKRWWSNFERTILLTTERLPMAILRILDENEQRKQRGPTESPYVPWRLINLEGTHLIGDHVEVVIDSNCHRRKLNALREKITRTFPDWELISDMMGDEAITHYSARGTNDLIGKNVISTCTSIAPQAYAKLAAINKRFNLSTAVRLSFLDRFDQTAGRNLGARNRENRHVSVFSPKLWAWLGPTLSLSRYAPTPIRSPLVRQPVKE